MSLVIARTPVSDTSRASASVGVTDVDLSKTTNNDAPTPAETRRQIAEKASPSGPLRTEDRREGGVGFMEAFLKTFAGKNYDKGHTVTTPQLGDVVPQPEAGGSYVQIDEGKPGEAAQVTVSPEYLKSIGEIAQVSILGLDKNGQWAVIDTARKESSERFVFAFNGADYTGSKMLLIEPTKGLNQHINFNS